MKHGTEGNGKTLGLRSESSRIRAACRSGREPPVHCNPNGRISLS